MEVVAAAKPDMRSAIAECAYFKAERRGFAPGYDLEDWLAAERELAAMAKPAKRKSGAVKKLK
jgi:hypothetical protein